MVKFHTPYPDDIIRRIGIIAIEGAALDFLLGRMLVKLTKYGVHEQMHHEDGFDQRRKVQALEKHPATPDAVRNLLAEMQDIMADRNFAIHGMDAIHAQNGQWVDVSLATRGKYLGPSMKRDAVWLDFLIERICNASAIVLAELGNAEPISSLDTRQEP